MQGSPRSMIHRIQSSARHAFKSQLRLDTLDQKDTTILKALAILAIVFHNFFHVAINVHENEFDFRPERFEVFLQTVVHPSLAIQAIFAFYGHYGVQIFMFLSAYGLARTHWDDPSSWHSFMWSRVKKLYPMFTLVVLFWASLAAMHVGTLWVIRNAMPHLLLMLLGVSTIFPNIGLPPVGPWWFIPFIMQAYALFPLLRWLTRRYGWPSLVVLSVACYFITHLANPVLSHWMINLSMTPIGRMRVLCLGIIAARYPIRIRSYIALPAFFLFILGSGSFAFAHFSSLAAVIVCLWLYSKLRPWLRDSNNLAKIGQYSLGTFLVNGIVRVPFIYFAHTADLQLTLSIASAAVSIAIASFFHYLLTPTPKRAAIARTPAVWAVEPTSAGSD